MKRFMITVSVFAIMPFAFAGTAPVVWFDMESTNAQGQVVNLGSSGAAANLTFAQYGGSLTNESARGQSLFLRGALNDGARFSCPDMTDRTISFWIRRDVDTGPYTDSTYPCFISGGPGNGMRVIFGKTSKSMTIYLHASQNTNLIFNENNMEVLDRHVWEHLAFTFASTSSGKVDFRVYLNGTQLYAKDAFELSSETDMGGSGAKQMIIGGNGSNRPISSCTDEFRIWDRALAADEIRAEYARVDKSLLARWPMDAIETDGEGRYVCDVSGYGTDLKVGPGVTSVEDALKGFVVQTDGTRSTYASAATPVRFADYTLTAWVKQSSDSVYDNIGKIGQDNGGPRFFVFPGGDYMVVSLAFNSGAVAVNSDTIYPALAAKDNWSHFALRVKNDRTAASGNYVRTYSVFMNGVLTEDRTHSESSAKWRAIGSDIFLFNIETNNVLTRPFEGRSADVRFYARALNDAEIAEIARGPAAVSAGEAFSTSESTAVLRGTVAPHGNDYFVDGFAGNIRWSLVSAPQGGEGSVILSPESAVTSVSLPVEGVYVFRLESSAGGCSTADEVAVTRISAVGTVPSVSLPSSATVARPLRLHLTGTVTGSERVFWRKVSGPGGVWFEPDDAIATDVTFSEAGSHVLRLTAENGGASASADVTVTVTDSTGTVALDDGLKIHWPMDVGQCSLERVSGADNSIRPDYTNSIYVAGARLYGISAVSNNAYVKTDRSLSFERSADGSFGYSTQPTSKWVSVSMWIYRDSRITHEVCVPYLLSAHQSLGLRFGRLDTGADGFTVQQQGLYGGTAELYYNPPSRSIADRWTHVYALYDRADGEAANFALYLDGERQTPAKSSGFPYKARIPNSAIEIGGIPPGRQVGPQMGNVKKGNDGDYYSATFPGAIDDIRIYNRPLTEAEIRTLASRPNLSENLPPVFSTDEPQTLRPVVRKTFTLAMSAFDDGLPAGGTVACEWRVVSGDVSNVVFTDECAPTTNVSILKAGLYTFQLVATDSERTSYSPPVTVEAQSVGTSIILR